VERDGLEISSRFLELSFRHLQMDPRDVNSLERCGLVQLRDVRDLNDHQRSRYGSVAADVDWRLEQLSENVRRGEIDWTGFWRESGIKLHWLAMTFPAGRLDEETRNIPLSSLRGAYGALLNIPLANNLESVGELVDIFAVGTRSWPGVGIKKIHRLANMMEDVVRGASTQDAMRSAEGHDLGKPIEFSELSFRHLQMDPKDVEMLEGCGLVRVRDLHGLKDHRRARYSSFVADVDRRLEKLSKNVRQGEIDWTGFWRESGIELHWMAMTFPAGRLDEETRNIPLSSLCDAYGALLNIPLANNLTSVGGLVDAFDTGTRPWQGVGAKKVSRIAMMLEDVLGANEVPLRTSVEMEPFAVPTGLPEDMLGWSVDSLGLRGHSDKLKRAGFETLGQLLPSLYTLRAHKGLGRTTMDACVERIRLLQGSVEGGEWCPEKLAELQGVPVFPTLVAVQQSQIIESIAGLVASISEDDPSEFASLIFKHRIINSGSDAASLQEVAEMLPSKITRERVRQIEKRILNKAAKLLLESYPVLGGPVVRPEVKRKFGLLKQSLTEREEIGPLELAAEVSKAWGCDVAEAFACLPIIMALIEGTARTSAELRRLADARPSLLRPLTGASRCWPVQNIGAERALSRKISQLGLRTLEDLRLAWLSGATFGDHDDYVTRLLDIAGSKQFDGTEPEEVLGTGLDRCILPAQQAEPKHYLENIREDVLTVIQTGTFWSDASIVFDRRTSRPPSERLTMQTLGDRLGRLGVTVKRTETDTLERLSSAFLGAESGFAPCIFRPSWLDMWSELESAYQRFSESPSGFRRTVEYIFGISEEQMTVALPTIWAVLSGVPTRKSHGKLATNIKSPQSGLKPVILSGFRRLH
jgi:hypothetical protein